MKEQENFQIINLEDKKVYGNPKSRCTIMIHNIITHERLEKYEYDINPAIAIEIKDCSKKMDCLNGYLYAMESQR